LKCWLPKEASKRHWSLGDPLLKIENWSKGSGNGCGAEQSCAAIIQRNLQPWANCSMVEVVFGTSENRRARLHTQFQWEIHAHTLKTTRRLSAPFPNSLYIQPSTTGTLGHGSGCSCYIHCLPSSWYCSRIGCLRPPICPWHPLRWLCVRHKMWNLLSLIGIGLRQQTQEV
jgi:hypothetical protein